MKEIINPKEVIEKRIAETMGFPKYAKVIKNVKSHFAKSKVAFYFSA